MVREATEFDAQCDLAAFVFGKPDEPDRLLGEFVRDPVTRGYRVVGLIQTRLDDGGAAVTVSPTGETIPLAQKVAASRVHPAPALATWDRLPRASTP